MRRPLTMAVAVAVVLSAACSALAYDTRLTWDRSQALMQSGKIYWNGFTDQSVLAGAFNMSVQYWQSGVIGDGTSIVYSTRTYCMDGVWLSNPGDYWTKVGSMPVSNNPNLNANSWAAVVWLNQTYRADSFTSAAKSAGLQLAIWEALNDYGSPDLTSGNFSVYDGSFGRSGAGFVTGSAYDYANQYLTGIQLASQSMLDNQIFYEDGQNQIGDPRVPEIPTCLLAPLGLAAVGAFRRRYLR